MVDDLARRLEEVRHHVEPGWDDARVVAALERFHAHSHSRRRRRVQVTSAMVVAAAAALALFVVGWIRVADDGAFGPQPRSIVSLPRHGQNLSRPASTLFFDDGSRATSLTEDSRLVATQVTSTEVRVRLERGAARFDVASRPERLFRVDAGDVSVLVLGTAFSVRRIGERSEVVVNRGRVRVSWTAGARVLSVGERGVFPPVETIRDESRPRSQPSEGDEARHVEPEIVSRRRGPARVRAQRPSAPSWRALAEEGRVDEAYAALEQAGGAASLRGLADALRAADVMRLSGHPAEAVDALEGAIAANPGDPRAAVASFTLGRVLLNQVGRPRAAASAFARARSLRPTGALAEDALAREVEALSRAGAASVARRRALEYLDRYPTGRRRRAVQRYGGVE